LSGPSSNRRLRSGKHSIAGRVSHPPDSVSGLLLMLKGEPAEATGQLERIPPDEMLVWPRMFNGSGVWSSQGKRSRLSGKRRGWRKRIQTPQNSRDCRGFSTSAGEIGRKRLRPAWGIGAYNLARVYWQLGLINPALQHARRAQGLGVQEAAPVVRSLAAALAPPIPVTIRRAK
jgi:hypothetical protein